MAIVIDSLAELRGPVARYLAGIEGSKGLYQLAEAYLGLDLTDDDGMEAIGLDRKTGLVFYENEGTVVMAVGVSYAKRFMENVRKRIRMFGPSTLEGSEGARLRVAIGPKLTDGEGHRWSLAWGVTEDHIGLVTWVGPGVDARAAWETASRPPDDVLEKPEAHSAAPMWATGEARGLNVKLPIPMIDNLLKQALGPDLRWSLGVEVDADTLRLRARLPAGRGLGKMAQFLQTDTPGSDFSEIFPKNTSLFMRSRVLVGEAGLLLAGLALASGEPAWPDKLPIPPISSLLGSLTGEFAIAVMGMDPAVQPMDLKDHAKSLPTLLQSIHTAWAFEATDEESANIIFGRVRAGAPQAGFVTVKVPVDGFEAFSMAKTVVVTRRGKPVRAFRGGAPLKVTRTYSLMRQGRILILLTGKGELRRFVDVKAGRAISLGSTATDAHMKAALQESRYALSAILMSTRITRELADKGVPPFFLTVINSIREVAVTCGVDGDNLEVVLEARQ